jgi:quercetin dioxygenase-like cupin family protein
MYFHDPKTRQVGTWAWGSRVLLGESLMLMVVDLDAEAIVPTHSHPQEQGGIVLEGEVEFIVAGESKKMLPGEIYMIPGGVEHSVKVGPAPARLLDVFHPIRDELKY